MKTKNIKSIISTLLVLVLVVGCFTAIPMANAAGEQTIYLKGAGSTFDAKTWNNIFYVGGAETIEDPTVWHIVYTGNDVTAITSMKLTFTNGKVFNWTPDMGFSTNNGDNNPGWVIAAPFDWTLAYVNSGNNNKSGCFVITTEGGNINFNISGYHQGAVPPIDPRVLSGRISLEKLVEGINIAIFYDGDMDAIDDLISFNLYAVERDGEDIEGKVPMQSEVHVNSAGFIIFDELADGWYAVEEVLTDAGKDVFEEHPVVYIAIANGVQSGASVDFDYDAFYTIVNGYGNRYIKKLGYDGLDGDGNLFYIGVTNTITGEVYASFCAHGGSKRFAGDNDGRCNGYLVAPKDMSLLEEDAAPFTDFILAYNYIENEYDNLNDDRVITQVVTWILLGAIKVDTLTTLYERESINLTEDEYEAIMDVIKNYQAAQYQSPVVDLVYLVCEDSTVFGGTHDFEWCQPQLVPIYGEHGGFDNKLLPPSGSIEVNYSVGEKVDVKGSITGGYSCDAQPTVGKNGKETWDHTAYAHSLAGQLKENGGSWFQYIEYDMAEGGLRCFDLVQGDKLTKVGGFTVEYVSGEFIVTLKDGFTTIGSAHISIANEIIAAKNVNSAKSGTIWTTAPGQQMWAFNGNSNSYKVDTCKWTVAYIYLHLDGITRNIDNKGNTINTGDIFEITLKDENGAVVETKDGQLTLVGSNYVVSATFDKLLSGDYTFTITRCDLLRVPVVELYVGSVTVVGGTHISYTPP